jgi:hypothetical protein
MLQALLGFDPEILAKAGAKEMAGYRLAGILFAAASASMVAADAYFGHMFYSGWAGVLLFGNLLGYIHFAVYRLAMITLTTRPLTRAAPGEGAENPAPAGGLKAWLKPDASSVFRFVFVSLIALAVSFPGAAIVYHRQAEEIQARHREQIMEGAEEGIGRHLCTPDSRFPFLVFQTLWKKPGYRLLVLLWTVWIFIPLLLLTRLRHSPGMQYINETARLHRELAERNYYTSLLEAQQDLDARFPGSFRLRDLVVYEDPPFNTRFKNRKDRTFGDHRGFAAYLNSLS